MNIKAFKTSKISDHKIQIIKKEIKKWIWAIFRGILIAGISFIILFPILTMVSMSIKSPEDLYDKSVYWLPKQFSIIDTVKNIGKVVKTSNYFAYLIDTILFVIISTVCHIFSACLTGYGFAKFNFKGKSILFACLVFTIVVPPLTTVIPQFLNFSYFNPLGIVTAIGGENMRINLNVWMWPVIILGLTGFGLKNGLYIFIFRQFFRTLPKELDEAANIDGCGVFKSFFYVNLPNAGGAILTVSIFSIVWQWTDNFYTTFFCEGINHMTSGLSSMISSTQVLANKDIYSQPIFSNIAMLLAIIPIILLYVILQNYFVGSVERSGLVE